jgi:hypothetical protein
MLTTPVQVLRLSGPAGVGKSTLGGNVMTGVQRGRSATDAAGAGEPRMEGRRNA